MNIPNWVEGNPEWASAFYLFQHSSLSYKEREIARYIDFEEATIEFSRLWEVAEGWSSGERVLLKAAWDLFNGGGNLSITDLVYHLDDNSLRAVLQAIMIRRKSSFDFKG